MNEREEHRFPETENEQRMRWLGVIVSVGLGLFLLATMLSEPDLRVYVPLLLAAALIGVLYWGFRELINALGRIEARLDRLDGGDRGSDGRRQDE